MPHSLSSWLATSVQSMPAAASRSRYSLDPLGRHGEGHVVHRADGAVEAALIGTTGRGGDTRGRLGRIGEPEEGQGVPASAVEEEMLTHPGRAVRWS